MKKIILLLIFLPLIRIAYSQDFEDSYGMDSCDFETPCIIVEMSDVPEDIWQVAVPRKTFFDSAYSDSMALLTSPDSTYPVNNHSSFIVKANAMAGNVIVSFWHKYDTDTLLDRCYIEASTDMVNWHEYWDSAPWGTIGLLGNENMYPAPDSASGILPGFSGRSDGWVHTNISWVWQYPMSIMDQPDSILYVKFNFVSDEINNAKEGWMIDNIRIAQFNFSGISSTKITQMPLYIYPNPSSNIVHIELAPNNLEAHEVVVYDILGKKVFFSKYGTSLQLNVSNWVSGQYIIHVTNKKGQKAIQKLLVQ